MTRRTLPFHVNTLNLIAFRARFVLPEMELTSFSAPKSCATRFEKRSETPQISANFTQPQYPGSTFTGLALRFPHRSHPDPTASS